MLLACVSGWRTPTDPRGGEASTPDPPRPRPGADNPGPSVGGDSSRMPTKRSNLTRLGLILSLVLLMIPALASAQSGTHGPPVSTAPRFAPASFALLLDPTDTSSAYPASWYWR